MSYSSYSAEVAFNLRKQFGFLEDNFDEVAVNNSAFMHGNMQLVGHQERTNRFCGVYMHFVGCARVKLHNIISLDGKNYKGKVFTRLVHHWCHKPSCPVCFKSGWAVRAAGKIEARLAAASKHFGVVEHIVCSIPPKDYGLSYEALRLKAHKVLFARGVIGGCKIFHGMRYNKRKYWYWSPHWHVLGFLVGGYSRCRKCDVTKNTSNCLGCSGFEGRTRRRYKEDKYIVKVLGKRKTVFGTAWYQLNHSTIDITKKRFHVATYFGVCSYRKLKITVEQRKQLCPVCQHELGILDYFGIKTFVLNRNRADYKRDSFEDYEEDGQAVWHEREPKVFR